MSHQPIKQRRALVELTSAEPARDYIPRLPQPTRRFVIVSRWARGIQPIGGVPDYASGTLRTADSSRPMARRNDNPLILAMAMALAALIGVLVWAGWGHG